MGKKIKEIPVDEGAMLVIGNKDYISVGKDGRNICISGCGTVICFDNWEDFVRSIGTFHAKFSSVKEEHKQQENSDKGFILTDSDSFQLCKKIKDNVFELYQITKVLPFTDVEKCYQVSHEVIDVNDVDVDSLCKIFYYHGRVRELEEEYGANWPQIVAEMAFEENAFQNLIDDEEMTYEDAKSLIKRLSGFIEKK